LSLWAPKATRFQPGRFGYPRGRTRQSQNGKTLLQQELNEVVLVNEGGIPRRMSKRQAFFKTLVNRTLEEPRYADLLMKNHGAVRSRESGTGPNLHADRVREARRQQGG
jgi:hypothetical protein